jgi:hypothetical protein
MRRAIVMVAALAVVPAASAFGPPGRTYYCGARQEKDTVFFRCVRASGQVEQTALRPKSEGSKELVPYRIIRETVEEHLLELPARSVRGFGDDGKPLAADKLAGLLAKERPVIVVVGEPDLKGLPALRKGTVILAVPVPPVGHGRDYSVVIPRGGQ